MNRPTPKVRDKQGKSSSTVPEKTSQGQEDSQSSVAAMKAMFDKKVFIFIAMVNFCSKGLHKSVIFFLNTNEWKTELNESCNNWFI
jgi:hypothetical protein